MTNKVKYGIVALIVVIGAIIFYNKVYIPKSTYLKVVAKKGNMNVEIFGIGDVGANNIYAINAQSAAKIKNLYVDAGDWVKKGDLLVAMDPVDLPQLLDEAKIGVKKASLALLASQKELQSLVAQKNLALVTYKRYEKLKAQSFASQSEYDKAKSDLLALEAQIEATKAGISSAKAEIKRAQKSVEALEVKLSRYKVYAPVDGYVIERSVDVGESVVPTEPIFKVVDPKTVWIKAYIDERISGNIKVGQSATITLRSQANKELQGHVARIAPQSDAVTQEREVDVAFEKLPIPFYVNEQAEVQIATKFLKNVVKIPANVLVHKKDKTGVWIFENGKAHFQSLHIIAITGNDAAVENLAEGSKILVPQKDKKPLFEGAGIR